MKKTHRTSMRRTHRLMDTEPSLAEAERLEQQRVQFELHAHRMRDYFYKSPQLIDARGWIDPRH